MQPGLNLKYVTLLATGQDAIIIIIIIKIMHWPVNAGMEYKCLPVPCAKMLVDIIEYRTNKAMYFISFWCPGLLYKPLIKN